MPASLARWMALDALLFPRSLLPVEAEKGKTLPDWVARPPCTDPQGRDVADPPARIPSGAPRRVQLSWFCQLYRAGAGGKRSSHVSSTRQARRPLWTSLARPWRLSIP